MQTQIPNHPFFLKHLHLFCALILFYFTQTACKEAIKPRLLVFTKTSGFRHDCIPVAREAVKKLGIENGFETEFTENSVDFTLQYLNSFQAVMFLQTTGNILNDTEQTAFEQYIQSGGGFVGVHSATDTEYEWKWYNRLVGGYFAGHPEQQNAKIKRMNKQHISTQHLPDVWERFDEWYNFKQMNTPIDTLLNLDEMSYQGGTMGEKHPIAWYHNFDGGRAWYTGLGHTDESYREPAFLKHILGGILWTMGVK